LILEHPLQPEHLRNLRNLRNPPPLSPFGNIYIFIKPFHLLLVFVLHQLGHRITLLGLRLVSVAGGKINIIRQEAKLPIPRRKGTNIVAEASAIYLPIHIPQTSTLTTLTTLPNPHYRQYRLHAHLIAYQDPNINPEQSPPRATGFKLKHRPTCESFEEPTLLS